LIGNASSKILRNGCGGRGALWDLNVGKTPR
jgi:hypothetical protein